MDLAKEMVSIGMTKMCIIYGHASAIVSGTPKEGHSAKERADLKIVLELAARMLNRRQRRY